MSSSAPKVLPADEPVWALELPAGICIIELLLDLSKDRTLFVLSHDLSLKTLLDRILRVPSAQYE